MWRVKPLALGSLPSLVSHVAVCRHASAAAGKGKQRIMAIRREDYGSQWERRAPLNPLHVKSFVEQSVKVLVQPSNRCAYPLQNVRLLDYEKIVDETGKCMVAFGKSAGIAGMISILHGIGLQLLVLGHRTLFIGAKEMIDELPVESVEPQDLKEVAQHGANSPFCVYDADHQHQHLKSLGFSGDGVVVRSIDNMPAQLPREATDFFGGLLFPLVPELLTSDVTKPIEEENFSRVIKDAIKCSYGKLTESYQYIQALKDKIYPRIPVNVALAEKKILVLGSGMMVPPFIEYLTRDKRVACTIASRTKEVAESLPSRYPNTAALYVNVDMHPDLLSKCIKEHDLVMTLLPPHLDTRIAKMCIEHKRHFATTNYTSPTLRALQQSAVDAGITMITECGLDPGIDHMLAMECFENAKQQGGKVKLFESWCGGLPAPEFSANPLKYKFSWSPVTALLAVTRDARYLKDQKEIYLPPGMHMDPANVSSFNFLPGFNLEGYCNRDAMQYIFLYDIPTVENVIRGTLRYKGYCHIVTALGMIGLVDENPHLALEEDAPEITWRELLCVTMGARMGKEFTEEEANNMVFEAVGKDQQRLQAIRDLGLLSDTVVTKKGSPVLTLSHHLAQKLSYAEGERDMVIIRNVIGVDWPDGSETQEEVGLTVYGEPYGFSAMAMTVGYPAAIAADMVLEGEIQQRGVVLPLSKDIYKPILNRLKAEGIQASTRSIKV